MTALFGHWFSRRAFHLFLSEQAGMTAGLLAAGAAVSILGPADPLRLLGRAALAAAVFHAALYLCDLYDARTARRDAAAGQRLVTALGLALLGLAVLRLAAPPLAPPPGSLLVGAAAAAMACFGLRAAFGRDPPERVLIVGIGDTARWIGRCLEEELGGDYRLAGYLDDGLPRTGPAPLPLALDGPARAALACARLRASVLVVASENRRGAVPPEELLRCRAAGVEVIAAWVFAERALRRIAVDFVHSGELALAGGWLRAVARNAAKRVLDAMVASAILLLSAPVLMVAMAAVRLGSPGPIFYRQERVGRRGRVFPMVKLRTMRADAEAESGPTWAGAADPRITRVGRWLRKSRVDEIPQLWNVLRGEMSMVGPRPERPHFVPQLAQAIPFYALREAARPGLTGWAQIRYPYGASLEDARAKLEYDLYYLKNGSLWLDLVVLFHTAKTVLMARGAR